MVPPSAATHALTAGAIGTLTLGMMSRVTLGHTGRAFDVSPFMVVGFVAITASAIIRVFGPWFRADLTATMLTVSAGMLGGRVPDPSWSMRGSPLVTASQFGRG